MCITIIFYIFAKKTDMLKFYNREKEMALLKKIEQKSLKTEQMTFVVGRRRIGKTSLITTVFAEKKTIYFFVEKKMKRFFVKNLPKKFKTNSA